MFVFFKNNKKEDYTKLTDDQLIVEYKKSKNKKLIGVLFQRYTHLVYGVCLKYLKNSDESKDAVMQVFEKLIADLLIHEVKYFKSWLYSVSRNHCLMKLRSHKHIQNVDELVSKKIPEDFMELPQEMHLDNVRNKDPIENLKSALSELKEEQRKCVELFYLKEKSYKEVAELTGYTIKNVKSFIQNGKRNLKNILDTM